MSRPSTELLDHLAVMAAELAPATAGEIGRQLSELAGAEDGDTLTSGVPRIRVLLARLAELWLEGPDISPESLALALISAQHAAHQVATSQTLELVWTGPKASVPVRRNDQALYEVVASADERLLVVSYAVFHVPRVRDGLVDAVRRGVDVKVVLEFRGPTGDQDYDPLVALGQLPEEVRVLHWPFEQRPEVNSRRGYIHAKCAVADERLAVISSANLTRYALEANMELGVLIHGGTAPQRIAQHFAELEAEGILQPFSALS